MGVHRTESWGPIWNYGEDMQISRAPHRNGHAFNLEFVSDEIDQLVSFVSAARIFRPGWLENNVYIRGNKPTSGKSLSYDKCVLISAFSWGYLRTLIAHT